MYWEENPIDIEPPKPKTKLHRMGELASRRVLDYFELDDLYTGVHVTPHAFVALTYAIDRQVLGFNDYDMLDIVSPGVIVGIVPKDGNYGELDADAYSTAQEFAELMQAIIVDNVRQGLLLESVADILEVLENYEDEIVDLLGSSNLGELEYFGIGYGGGDIGNRANPEIVRELLPKAILAVIEGADLRKTAMRLAMRAVPQTRIMRDIYDTEIVHIVIPAPYKLSAENPSYDTTPYFYGIEEYVEASEDEINIDRLNYLTLRDGTTIYKKPHDPSKVAWHGSGLEEMSAALPNLLTAELQQQAREAGSALDEDELREEFEDEDY
jgi:hypothetical protein